MINIPEGPGKGPGCQNIPMGNNSTKKNYSPEYKQFDDLHFRLLKVRPRGKEAVERGWQTFANYRSDDPIIARWISQGGNWGITCSSGFCCFVDADTQEIQEALDSKLPMTFRYSTGKEGHFQYVYFLEDEPLGCIPLAEGAYIKGKGGYALGPGSTHPNGTVYGAREIRNVPVAVVKRSDLLDALKPFLIGKETGINAKKPVHADTTGTMAKIIEKYNIKGLQQHGAWLQGPHPVHGSESGTNFTVNLETGGWHCFRHGTGGGAVSLIAVLEGIIPCEEATR